jgi:hypothetical protein
MDQIKAYEALRTAQIQSEKGNWHSGSHLCAKDAEDLTTLPIIITASTAR